MRPPRRTAGRTAFAGGLVAAGALAAARRAYRSSLPRHDGVLHLPGLSAPVSVVRDANGTPHVRAVAERDAIAALGFCHAQDRLFQMELLRRLTRGRLAELVGKAGLETDRYVRILGLGDSADGEAASLTGDDRTFLLAYCAGVNAWLESPAFRLPVELRALLAGRPARWEPGDALLPIRFLALTLGMNWEAELVRARLQERLGERLDALDPGYPATGITTIPDAAITAVAAAIRTRSRIGGPASGSNNWVLDGSRTTTGSPILANDPHLGLQAPAVWYVADLAWDGGRAAGATVAGLPAVVIGQSTHAAWGFTNTMADTQDLFRIDLTTEPHTTRREEIVVRGRRQAHVEEVVVTRHGPVVTPLAPGERTAFALSWTALAPGRTVQAFRALPVARTGDEVVAALEGISGTVLNCVWATVDGEVGYQMIGGPIPIRGRGDGRLPQDGSDAAAGWVGTIPYGDLPAWRAPAAGAIVTANNRIVSDEYPYPISREWLAPYRAERIGELLAARERHSVDDCAAIQVDVRSLPLGRLARLLASTRGATAIEAQALSLLGGWDGEMSTGSVAASVAATWHRHLVDDVFAEVGGELDHFLAVSGFSAVTANTSFFGQITPALLGLLESREDAWFGDGRTWDGVAAKTLERACRELERRLGPDLTAWTWGELHTLELAHPLGTIPGLGRLLGRGPMPLPGDTDTVWVGWQPPPGRGAMPVTTGPGVRFIADLADPDNTRIVLCGGQSGHPASGAYDDQLTDWLLGRTRRLHWSDGAIAAAAVATLTLEP